MFSKWSEQICQNAILGVVALQSPNVNGAALLAAGVRRVNNSFNNLNDVPNLFYSL